MSIRFFRQWNWEFDFGVDQLPSGVQISKTHAVGFYDRWDHIYRVEIRSNGEARAGDKNENTVVDVYDYFCARDGRILQKRSIDEHGVVQLIVDFEYSGSDVTEIAWWPDSNVCKQIRRSLPN